MRDSRPKSPFLRRREARRIFTRKVPPPIAPAAETGLRKIASCKNYFGVIFCCQHSRCARPFLGRAGEAGRTAAARPPFCAAHSDDARHCAGSRLWEDEAELAKRPRPFAVFREVLRRSRIGRARGGIETRRRSFFGRLFFAPAIRKAPAGFPRGRREAMYKCAL